MDLLKYRVLSRSDIERLDENSIRVIQYVIHPTSFEPCLLIKIDRTPGFDPSALYLVVLKLVEQENWKGKLK